MNLTDRLRGAQRKVSTFFVFNMFYTVNRGMNLRFAFGNGWQWVPTVFKNQQNYIGLTIRVV